MILQGRELMPFMFAANDGEEIRTAPCVIHHICSVAWKHSWRNCPGMHIQEFDVETDAS